MIDKLEQSDGGEPEYDYVREDGVWGEEITLVGWILADSCNCRLDGRICFLCVDYEIRCDVAAIPSVIPNPGGRRRYLPECTLGLLRSKQAASRTIQSLEYLFVITVPRDDPFVHMGKSVPRVGPPSIESCGQEGTSISQNTEVMSKGMWATLLGSYYSRGSGVGILPGVVRMAKSAKRSILETTKPGTGGYSRKVVV